MKSRTILFFSILFAFVALFSAPPALATDLFNRELPEWAEQSIPQTPETSGLNSLTADWTNTNLNWGGDLFNVTAEDLQVVGGYLYAGFSNDFAEVWQYNGSTWTKYNIDGFGNLNNFGVYALASFNDKLVAATGNSVDGMEVWQYDGGWGFLTTSGFGDINNAGSLAITVFNGELYVAAVNAVTGAEIWKSNGSFWTQVNVDGFGIPSNQGVYSMVEYNAHLYAATVDFANGTRIYRYDGGTTWTQVNTTGFGNTHMVATYTMAT